MKSLLIGFLALGVVTSHKLAEPELVAVNPRTQVFLNDETVKDLKDINDITGAFCIYENDRSFYDFGPLVNRDS